MLVAPLNETAGATRKSFDDAGVSWSHGEIAFTYEGMQGNVTVFVGDERSSTVAFRDFSPLVYPACSKHYTATCTGYAAAADGKMRYRTTGERDDADGDAFIVLVRRRARPRARASRLSLARSLGVHV